jgi:hypothetical protein
MIRRFTKRPVRAERIVGTTVLGGSSDVVGFSIEGESVIGTDKSPYGYPSPDNVAFYNYPAGGKPTKTSTRVSTNLMAWL